MSGFRSNFLIFSLILITESAILTRFDNKLLKRNCGRYVEGYNSFGVRPDDDNSIFKVLYGEKVGIGIAPWVASIALKGFTQMQNGKRNYFPHGTGSIISPYHIISAAHLVGVSETPSPNCATGELGNAFYMRKPEDFVIFVNTTCSTPAICQKVGRSSDLQPFDVQNIYIPKGYVGDGCPNKESINDVVIFELATPITFSNFVYPVCLPDNKRTNDFEKTELELYGFGRDPSDTKNPIGILRTFSSRVSSRCPNYFSYPGTFCTKAVNSTFSLSCDGDSGSGLVSRKKVAKLVGILSAGVDCGMLFNAHRKQLKNKERLTVEHDIHIDVSKHLNFFCQCCGICPLKNDFN